MKLFWFYNFSYLVVFLRTGDNWEKPRDMVTIGTLYYVGIR